MQVEILYVHLYFSLLKLFAHLPSMVYLHMYVHVLRFVVIGSLALVCPFCLDQQ